jgi:hypothetical protein
MAALTPQLHAQAGVPRCPRIELGETGPRALVYQLTALAAAARPPG